MNASLLAVLNDAERLMVAETEDFPFGVRQPPVGLGYLG